MLHFPDHYLYSEARQASLSTFLDDTRCRMKTTLSQEQSPTVLGLAGAADLLDGLLGLLLSAIRECVLL